MVDVDLDGSMHVHVVGVGGAGMSAIASVLTAMGHRVSGSDLRDSPGLERLRASGVRVAIGHGPENVGDADIVAISTAIPPTNVEVVAALDRGIRVLRRAEILTAIASTRETVAVAGTHGKTTTASMLALVLVEAGLRPSFIIGGELNEIGSGAVWDHGDVWVVEADESDGTFLALGAQHVVVTNIEPDHLEHYGGWEPLRDAFEQFVREASGVRVLCLDDPEVAALAGRLRDEGQAVVTYGTHEAADNRMVDVAVRIDRRVQAPAAPSPHGIEAELVRGGMVGTGIDEHQAVAGLHGRDVDERLEERHAGREFLQQPGARKRMEFRLRGTRFPAPQAIGSFQQFGHGMFPAGIPTR